MVESERTDSNTPRCGKCVCEVGGKREKETPRCWGGKREKERFVDALLKPLASNHCVCLIQKTAKSYITGRLSFHPLSTELLCDSEREHMVSTLRAHPYDLSFFPGMAPYVSLIGRSTLNLHKLPQL